MRCKSYKLVPRRAPHSGHEHRGPVAPRSQIIFFFLRCPFPPVQTACEEHCAARLLRAMRASFSQVPRSALADWKIYAFNPSSVTFFIATKGEI